MEKLEDRISLDEVTDDWGDGKRRRDSRHTSEEELPGQLHVWFRELGRERPRSGGRQNLSPNMPLGS